ncbi:MAG: leucine-rich repeat protein [Prevotella sp.]|nr:leucine-rich repeat protein [Prevotella sp.]
MVQRILLNHYLARTAGMLSGARRASLMLLVMLLTTSTAWAQDPATIGSIHYSSTLSAYEINSVDNLNDLAVYVNGKGTYSIGGDESDPHTCSGLSFKMTAPITYDGSENNFTPIGNYSQSFDGTFDGQGKTISGININNTSATYQAIFGSIHGTVKNLVVSNCSIVAYQQVGAIAGTIRREGTIENCSVGNNVTLSGHSDIGGISGGNDSGTIKGCTCAATINGTEASGHNACYLGGIAGSASGAGGPTPYLTDNLFTGAIGGYLDKYIGAIVGRSNDASLTNNIYTSTGFGGIGAASSSTGADGVGASRPYSVTFDENGGTAVPDLEVALGTVISAPATTREGYTLTGWKNGSTDFDFSTPVTSDLELTAQWVEKIPYIDADGNTAYCTNYTVLDNTMTTISAGWYVVKNDVEFNGNLSTDVSSTVDNTVNIILCDGATLTANYIFPNGNRDNLRIYGQSQGTGTANISGSIEASGSLQIYGGTINAAHDIDCAQSSVGIYGGTVTARSLVASNTGSQIRLGGDTVKANSYSAHNGVTILTGITYYDGTGASYTGNLTSDQISAIRGKTLRTYDYRSGTCGKDDPATGDVDESQNVTWMLTGNTLTISGTGAMADYTDANYQPWAANRLAIKTIVINEGVTSIGKYAFSNCESVTSGVSIPASVTSIGNYSFNYCSMTSLTIPSNSSLETIGSFAFNCAGFGSVTIPASVKSIGNNAFDGSAALTTVTLNSNPFIGESAFYSSTAVTMNLTANGPVDGAYWTTFYNKNYNFQADANTQVFKAALSGTSLTLTELTTDKIVNKDNAVILKSTASPIMMTLTTTDSSNDFTGNSLQGVDDPAGLTADGTMYVLNNGTNGVGFYKLTAGKTLGVGKAYLTYTGTLAPGFFGLDVDNENTTEVGLIDNSQLTIDNWAGAIYDLQGRKIANGQKPTAKGLYIVNGKKVMIK